MKRRMLFSAVALVLFPLTTWAAQGATPAPTSAASKSVATKSATASTGTRSKSTAAKSGMMHHRHAAKKVDVNTATKEELMTLRGVDEATAEKIIADRPFRTKSDLLGKKVVTKQEYRKIASSVTVKPATPEAAKK
jgi:competence protein ComEA